MFAAFKSDISEMPEAMELEELEKALINSVII
jgi:hypothetical protein